MDVFRWYVYATARAPLVTDAQVVRDVQGLFDELSIPIDFLPRVRTRAAANRVFVCEEEYQQLTREEQDDLILGHKLPKDFCQRIQGSLQARDFMKWVTQMHRFLAKLEPTHEE
ncbi:unnamed protein product [Vitrella brassicaformis CCMP3155]|uniref:Uncharacterized protein n=1 Tax=Vitrella brassicaformis (strain CCMP3155) TaxID=1169540 RepID=A0A0G4EFC8_VITBC|nr:unnamed protein product [Vitrella brassicaformis CCMP3155]|eukprot:CEL94216.1 unnamed protein product [Vitrella brassicaformis CCMP3155]